MNVLNGGAHAGNSLDIQEFMLVPVGADTFRDALRMGAEIYHALGSLVGHCGVGDEGGYAPSLASHEEALDLLCRAIETAGYRPGADVCLALDAAVSAWYDAGSDRYRLPKSGKALTREELLTYWQELARRYPLLSLEDGMGEDDEAGWQALSGSLGERMQLVGDDLFVTNPVRIARGVEQKLANAVLIKPNQIGTLTETVEAVRAAQAAGWSAILSHRSGETEDSTIADLAVALGCAQIKAGAPCRGERTAKYNRLLAIEQALGGNARYAGRAAFTVFRSARHAGRKDTLMNEPKRRAARHSLTGTGLYIALFLGLTALAVAGYWMLLPSSANKTPTNVTEPPVTTPITAEPVTPDVPEVKPEEPAEPVQSVVEVTVSEKEPEATEPVTPVAPRLIVSPLSGETVAAFSMDELAYSETLADWRTHDGIDIKADAGTQVLAASSGTVLSVADDDLMGTTVVIAHDGGYETTYSNLQSVPTVAPEQYVSAGQVIGAVGTTSLAEASMSPHLHFSVTKDGEIIDPQEFLKS